MEQTMRQYRSDLRAQRPIIDRNMGRPARSSSPRTLRVFLTVLFIIALLGASSLVFPKVTRGQTNTWTFMVYMDGDNDLERVAILDFLEMAAVGSTPNVNIVVEFDRSRFYDTSYGNWNTTKRFLVTSGMTPTAANASSDIGEVNMGNASTLVDFIDWGVTAYPANNYALVLWDHGGGWSGVCWDYTPPYDWLN
ncbi:MAG: hypothetical protein KJ563_04945, partial [Candidatus Thermoplasmatota archaeon]|nr:hypothetical protein [Candidatus Thermoplasmatota archaeon]